MQKLIVTGGGTGGHIYPALAIADGLRQRMPEADIRYIGARGGMESRIVPGAGYPFWGIRAEGWQGRKIPALPRALKVDFEGKREAQALLAAFQPGAVIGTGGFVCLPVGMAAAQMRIPILLHEQNALPGLTNRLIALWAKRIFVSFEEAADRFPPFCKQKVSVTGLPVRQQIAGADRTEASAYFQLDADKKTVLVVGGSQGAASINRAMLHVVAKMYQKPDVQVVLATGQRDYRQMEEEMAAAGIEWEITAGNHGNIRMLPYIDRMDLAFAASDLYVGRAGASTLAEITLNKLPAVLIPLPHAAENHQAYNAASLADKGAAVTLEDSALTGPALLRILEELLADDRRRLAMAGCSFLASHSRALDAILDIIEETLKES